MSDLKNFARVILIGAVTFIVLPSILALLFVITGLFSPSALVIYKYLEHLLPMVARILLVSVIVYLFFRKIDAIVNYLIKEDAALKMPTFSPAGVYRLATVIMGGFFIYDAVVGIGSVVGKIIDQNIRFNFTNFEWGVSLTQVLSMIILLALGIYLLTGAPHFVKWQVRKTLEQCKEQDAEKAPDSAQS